MPVRPQPRVLSIAPGQPFLPTLAKALLDGRLVEGFRGTDDPLALAKVTIYVPTRRAARELRSDFTDVLGGRSAILPTIRPLGEFDEDMSAFDDGAAALDLAPPIGALDRYLLLAPLVQRWKQRLPAHIAARFGEEVTVPASAADAVWLARDLAALIDDVESHGGDWSRLGELVPDELAGWWQVTLDFLAIVTEHLPQALLERRRSSPGAHRAAMIDAEAARLMRSPPAGPVIAAGSTGSIPATARLLAAIARLENGAVVLPGLDHQMDARSWAELARPDAEPALQGHPQSGLCRLLAVLGVARDEVMSLGNPAPQLAARSRLLAEALRPAPTTDDWAANRAEASALVASGAMDQVALIEAGSQREEALAVATALRHAISQEGSRAALVTADRELARRVAVELGRFGIAADDSAGRPLALTAPAELLMLAAEVALSPGDLVALVSLLKHPLLRCGRNRADIRRAAEITDLVCFRGGTGRPTLTELDRHLERRMASMAEGRPPFWLSRLSEGDIDAARSLVVGLKTAMEPLLARAVAEDTDVPSMARATVLALEALGRDASGSVQALYAGDAGADLAAFLRDLIAAEPVFSFAPADWPDILRALLSGAIVKPQPGADTRVAIWGPLEARLQSVDTLVLGGLNEGSWPRRAEPDRFMSRLMKAGLDLGPPERRLGQAAHDFAMAMGAPRVILSRALRAGDAPAVASRWLQRIDAYLGGDQARAMRHRGERYMAWARELETLAPVPTERRPEPRPPVDMRPRRFSVTEIETLRRDPYAVYARRILRLNPVDPLIRDPGAAERGTLFHAILHAFTESGIDPHAPDALDILIETGRRLFADEQMPSDVNAVWWPRFLAMAPGIIKWERDRQPGIVRRLAEARARDEPIGATGITLSGYADRIDLHAAPLADILDYKTGYTPSRAQAHSLLAPQLALEGALLMRGAFSEAGSRAPSELAHIRLKADGKVIEETILKSGSQVRTAEDLANDAWSRLERLMAHYLDPSTGYLSRALPFREGDTSGHYDHLARVLEWSAGADAAEPDE